MRVLSPDNVVRPPPERSRPVDPTAGAVRLVFEIKRQRDALAGEAQPVAIGRPESQVRQERPFLDR